MPLTDPMTRPDRQAIRTRGGWAARRLPTPGRTPWSRARPPDPAPAQPTVDRLAVPTAHRQYGTRRRTLASGRSVDEDLAASLARECQVMSNALGIVVAAIVTTGMVEAHFRILVATALGCTESLRVGIRP